MRLALRAFSGALIPRLDALLSEELAIFFGKRLISDSVRAAITTTRHHMRNPRFALAGLPAIIAIAPAFAQAQAPTPAGVLSAMERVADWQLDHPPFHEPTHWAQAVGDA